jgi:hypothetical protein
MINIILPETAIFKTYAMNPYRMVLFEDTWCIIDGKLFEAKKGFWFDGMSISRIMWTPLGLTPFDPKTILQVFWHDIFYNTQYFKQWKADSILEAMNKNRNEYWKENKIDCQLGYSQIKAISGGLYVGGWKAYNSKTEKQIAGASKHLYINGEQFIP